jgi:beta-mannosidase
VALTAGVNRLTVPIHIDNPALWYPNGYGNQARYNFLAYFDKPVSAIQTTTGLRKVQLRRQADQYGKSFEFIINDIPVFAKGANVIPFDSFPERVTPETHRKILEAARDAHMNMVRAWGGGYYESDDFYDICDELGLMVWQEFMFGGAMVPGDTAFSDNVKIEAEQQVQRLRNHSCIVLWCGNNEVETGWRHWGDRLQFQKTLTAEQREHVWQSYLHIFNDILKGTVETMADSTPYWPSSPSANYEEDPDNQHNGDMHYWSVWHALEPIEKYNDITPRFMSEFGFQSFPEMSTIKSFAGPDDLRIDSPVMLAHQKNSGGNERIRTYMLRQYREPKDFASFVYLSQVQQAEAIKTCAEHLRRSRPKTMGSLYWQLNDCWPVASWSSIDYLGRWKALHYYVRRFYNDLLISPCRQAGAVETTVVSDKQEPVKAAIRIRLMDFFGKCLNERKKDLVISGAGSQIVDTVPEKELLAGQSPENVFVLCELSVADKVESKNLLFFSPAKSLNLPAQIVKHNFRLGPNGVLMTFSSDVLARDVYVSFGDLDARLPDNFFDLLPGQSVEFEIKTLADLEELEKSLSILTLANYK